MLTLETKMALHKEDPVVEMAEKFMQKENKNHQEVPYRS